MKLRHFESLLRTCCVLTRFCGPWSALRCVTLCWATLLLLLRFAGPPCFYCFALLGHTAFTVTLCWATLLYSTLVPQLVVPQPAAHILFNPSRSRAQLEVSSLIAESRARQLADLEAANSQKDELVLKLRTTLRLLWGVNQNAQSKAREQQTLATEAADLLENLESQVAQVVGVTRLSSEVSAADDEPKVGRTHSCGV